MLPVPQTRIGEIEPFTVGQSMEMGLLPPNPSLTHPAEGSLIHGDGVRVKALVDAGPGETFVDTATGEVRTKRFDPDAHEYNTRDKSRGTHWAHWEVYSELGSMILDVEHVRGGDEAGVATACAVEHIRPLAPWLIGALYDRAMRGVHHQTLLENGMLLINIPHAEENPGRRGRRTGPRVPKSSYLRDVEVTLPDGRTETRPLYAIDGDFVILEIDETGKRHPILLERIKTRMTPRSDGGYRWYNDLRLPRQYGGAVIFVRLDITSDDRKRGFNRTEYTRAIGPSDPDYSRLHGRRSNAETNNGWLKDQLFRKRARSIGWRRQKSEMLGWALLINSLYIAEHRRQLQDQAA